MVDSNRQRALEEGSQFLRQLEGELAVELQALKREEEALLKAQRDVRLSTKVFRREKRRDVVSMDTFVLKKTDLDLARWVLRNRLKGVSQIKKEIARLHSDIQDLENNLAEGQAAFDYSAEIVPFPGVPNEEK